MEADILIYRFATYNTEWFNTLFDDSGRPLADLMPSSRYQIDRATQLQALGVVFTALDADGIMVIEAPDTSIKRSSTRALENFAALFGLRTTAAVTGFMSDTEQEITFLYDPKRMHARHDPQGLPAPRHSCPYGPRFDSSYACDLYGDGQMQRMQFSKPPLELALRTAGGSDLRLIGVHAKSKAPHGAKDAADAIRIALNNRRKQLAECRWLRERVEDHLHRGDALLVMGDFNDGPGLDDYESLFGASGVELVLGDKAAAPLRLYDPHAIKTASRPMGLHYSTSRFWLAPEQRYFEALLDFIMVSPDLAARRPAWRIWHPWNDPACLHTPELHEALLQASDHFPVTIDIRLDD